MGDMRVDLVGEILDNCLFLVEPRQEVGRVLGRVIGDIAFDRPEEYVDASAGVGQAAQCICSLMAVLVDPMETMDHGHY